MPNSTLTEAYVQTYKANVIHLYQQQGSKLRGRVREKPTSGKYEYFERLGPTEAYAKSGMFTDTVHVYPPHTRRRAEFQDYVWATMIPKDIDPRILIEPQGEYTLNGSMAMGRRFDRTVIDAITADAYEGETGQTTVTWASFISSNPSHSIANGGTGLTVAKIRSAKETLDNAEVPDEMRTMIVSPTALVDLLEDTNVTSSDFNTIKVLVDGQMNSSWMGFDFVRTTLLPKSGNIRTLYAFHQFALGALVAKDMEVRIDPIATANYDLQIWMMAQFGAVRVLDEGVVEIFIDESV